MSLDCREVILMSNTPKIRFPEFKGEWREYSLNELGDFYKGSGISKNDLSEVGNPCILYGELYTIYKEVIDSVKSKTNIDTKKLFYGKRNDVLIPSSGETAIDIATASCLQKDDVVLGGDLNIFRPKKVNGIFISYQLSNVKRTKIARLAQGASVVHLYNEHLKKINVEIPHREEQDKIANFLSLVDKKISKQIEKVNHLKTLRNGTMSKLFSQEIRFKKANGENYPKWRNVTLVDILSEVNEKTKINNQHEVISSTTNGVFLQKEYFNRSIASDDNTGYKILKRSQIVLSPQNLWMGNINYNDKYDIGIVSPSYKIFDINSEFDKNYIGYIVRTPRAFYEYMKASEQGASIVRRNLSMDLFEQIVFNIPCKEEQERISKYLNKLDIKINLEQEMVDKLINWKRGLIQQIFI